MADLVAGDTGSAVRVTLRHANGLPFALTAGLLPYIRLRMNDSASVSHAMAILDPDNGIVQYTFLPTELAAGTLYVEFEIRS